MFTVNPTHCEKRFSTLSPEAVVVVCEGKTVLLSGNGSRLPLAGELGPLLSADALLLHCGTLDGASCWCAEENVPLRSTPLPPSFVLRECRLSFVEPGGEIINVISRGRNLCHWRKAHRRCGACGAEMAFAKQDLALVCPSCGQMVYPQIAPAVITAITRNGGREILLAHNKRFTSGTYSLIAGFVEAGESLEQAVEREILEETGIRVKNVRYLASQPWPFPNSLMLGFSAEYESGEPYPADGELSDLGWYTADAMPPLPTPGSIAHRIITDYFLDGKLLEKHAQ